MFHWLRKKHSGFNRNIFRFWDGEKERAVDPLAVFRSILSDKDFNLKEDMTLMEEVAELTEAGKDCEAITTLDLLEAQDRAATAVRRALGVPVYSENGKPGFTTIDAIDTLHQLLEYMGDQKKSTNT